jgi:hypothetical protein
VIPCRRTARSLRALLVLLAALVLLAPAAHAAISYEHESEQAYQSQLAGHEIASVTINKRLRTLRITLKDGRHVLARYPKKTEPEVAAKLKASGAAVAVLSKAQAENEAKKVPVHHKIRYIAGGILIAVIVIVVGVLLINRRRRVAD